MRPLSVGEVVDGAIKLYTRNAKVLIGAAAGVVVPLLLLQAIVLLSVYTNGSDLGGSGFGQTATPGEASARLGAAGIRELVAVIGSAFVVAACVKAISDSYLGQVPRIGESLRFGARRLLPLIVLQILYVLGLIVGFVLLIVPGVYLYAAWSVASPALVIERRGPFHALGRSRRLVKGRWWGTAGVIFIANVLNAVIGGVVVGVLTAVALNHHNPSVLFAVSVTTLATAISQILLQPFVASITTVLYYDLRVRHEGYDIELMAEQLGLHPSALPEQAPGFQAPVVGPESVGRPGGPPYWPPPPGWQPGPEWRPGP